MPRNGAGTYTLPAGNPVVTGTVISSTVQNNTATDIATAITNSIAVDGQSVITANIPFANNKITGLAAPTASGDAISLRVAGTSLLGALNDTKTTVASVAGSPDIWTSTGAVIDYTGALTATGFAAAPQAGATRRLVCASAAPFTAGANLLIQGVASGSTYTAQAGEVISVIAITTTQFRIVAQFPFLSSTSSTFTFDGSGGSSGSVSMKWQVQGNFVTLNVPAMTPTSGTGSVSLVANTALPAAIRPSSAQSCPAVAIVNSGTAIAGGGALFQISTGGIVSLSRDGAGTAWSNATSCGLNTSQTVTYSLT